MQEAEVQISTAEGLMDTFVCHPEEGGKYPSVIIYMDAPGIREELRDMARRLASVGYYVLLPNMYYRIGREGSYGFDLGNTINLDSEREKMFSVMRSLTNSMVISDTGALLDHLRATELVAKGGSGCIGYCMSGQYVMSVGAAYPSEFAAIASFYGVGIVTEEQDSPHLNAHKIRGEVYLAFASKDPWVPKETLDSLPTFLADAGVRHRVEVYPDTEHGFAFPQRPVYVKAAAERHWERIFALLGRNLKS